MDEMKPYYQDDSVTIYHGDCREILPTLEPVDLVLTDPPYGKQTHNGARTRIGKTVHIENVPLIDFAATSVENLREVFSSIACSRWLVATMEWQHIAELERNPPTGWAFIRMGIWVKPNGAPQFSGDRPSMGWEGVGIFHRNNAKLRWNGGGKRAVWTYNAITSDHPTEKPISLYREFAILFSDPNGTILDPFMGSGTRLRAAKDLGRKAIGIEIEERYCEIAAKRMSQTVMSLQLD